MLPCLGKSAWEVPAWGRFDNVKDPLLKESKHFMRDSPDHPQEKAKLCGCHENIMITFNLVSSLSSWQRL